MVDEDDQFYQAFKAGWHAGHNNAWVVEMDPATGKLTEFPYPLWDLYQEWLNEEVDE